MNISTLDLCRAHLFTAESDIIAQFGEDAAERVMRVRQMYMWRVANPDAKDRQFIDEFRSRFPMGKNAAQDYLKIVNQLLPLLSEKSRDFHRWRFNEMILETYQMAKARKDTKTMERAASSYGKLNKVDAEDVQTVPYHLIVVQPFTATDEPRVLGIEPIPDLKSKIKAMIDKYSAETLDIEDVDYEEADLEFDSLFPLNPQQTDEESVL
ncbi:MAG: hypothetical protein NC044_08970 [Prevotella sp.]|nr:hypothetical protein [Bacteroides sp.]MCM1446519.1 hypothetical protein [Prevotella sp.]